MRFKSGMPSAAFGFMLALTVFASTALAAGKVVLIDKFINGTGTMTMMTYFDPSLKIDRKIGIIVVLHEGAENSVAVAQDDVQSFMNLWLKAVTLQSGSWQDVGQFNDAAHSKLAMRAVPGVSFVISSPAKGSVTYLVPRADMDRFTAALRKMQASLTNQASE